MNPAPEESPPPSPGPEAPPPPPPLSAPPPTPVATSADKDAGKVTGNLTPPVAAGLACIFSIFGGIVFLVLESRNKFVRFWAMQATLLGLLAFAVAIILYLTNFVLGNMPLIGGLMNLLLWLISLAFQLAWLAAYIVSIIKSFSGQEWEIPWLGKLARQLLAKLDAKT